ncbi:transmembrane protease serine 9-like [Cydia splendana]|uniref:transmembrane protease serine 9-like n=1 Tax=Cydia splendana TaxID=1100963 RepID=UPI00300D8872
MFEKEKIEIVFRRMCAEIHPPWSEETSSLPPGLLLYALDRKRVRLTSGLRPYALARKRVRPTSGLLPYAFARKRVRLTSSACLKTPTCAPSMQNKYFISGCGERNEEPRIVGGSAASINAFPWLARLIYHNAFGCGASLINDKYVVSAAHCLKGFMWFMFRVTFGEHNRCDKTTRPITRYVTKVIAHNFSLSDLSNDIALLKISSPITYSHAVRPVCLPKYQGRSYENSIATVSGWGATGETKNWSCTLLEAELPVLSNQECRHTKYNASRIQEAMLCAGFPKTAHKDACTGDSGGPLITENSDHVYELIGIVSWGYGCARLGYPGVYTRVTKYLDWIRDNTDDACYCRDQQKQQTVCNVIGTKFNRCYLIFNMLKWKVVFLSAIVLAFTIQADEELLKKIQDDEDYEKIPKCNCRCGERNEASRIVGGVETMVNEFPWMARLTYFQKFYCGGILINDRYVLTAAHCTKGLMWFMIKVTLGEHNRCNETTRPETRFVTSIVAHNFTYTTFRHDIALLRLNQPVNITDTIKPICLPHSDDATYVGVKAIAAGWGSVTEQRNHSCVLNDVELPVLSNDVCKKSKYEEAMIADDMLCAGFPDQGMMDTCQGDSGGPLAAERRDKRYELLGVVSWGIGCGRAGYPGVYTRVTKYLYWIRHNARQGCFCSD